MGANFTEAASTQAARAVTSQAHMADRFDCETGIHPEASAHTTKSDEADVLSVVKVLLQREVLTIHPGQSHHKFPNIATNPLQSLNHEKLHQWVRDKVKDHTKFQQVQGDILSDDEFSEED